MKKTKKLAVVLTAVLGICLMMCLAACGEKYGDSEYLGIWKCTAGEAAGITVDVEKIIGSFEIVLEADGTAKATISGDSSSGEWEPSDDGFTLKDSKQELDFKKDGDKIKADYNSVTLYFEKSK